MPYLEGRHCHSYIREPGQARTATAPLNQNFQQGSKDEPCLILAFPLFCRCTRQGHLLSSPPQSSSLWRSTLFAAPSCANANRSRSFNQQPGCEGVAGLTDERHLPLPWRLCCLCPCTDCPIPPMCLVRILAEIGPALNESIVVGKLLL